MFYLLFMSFPSIFKVIFCFMAWHKLITKPYSLNSYFNHLFSFKHFVLPNYWVSCNDLDVNMYFWTYMRIKGKAMLNGGWNLEMTHAKLASIFPLLSFIFCSMEPRINLLISKVKKIYLFFFTFAGAANTVVSEQWSASFLALAWSSSR